MGSGVKKAAATHVLLVERNAIVDFSFNILYVMRTP